MTVVNVAVNGFGTIGKRVAEAIQRQPDMKLVGVAKTRPDYSAIIATRVYGFNLYVPQSKVEEFEKHGIKVAGTIEEMVEKADIIVDATPGGKGAEYKNLYVSKAKPAIFQGGEKADVADISFSTLCNFEKALGARYIRVVSCNTTGLLRALCTLKREFGLRHVRAVIVRRAADPKEVKRGPVNAIVPDPAELPSHHGLDVKTVVPDIDIVTAAVVVPTTLMHVHIVYARLEKKIEKKDVEALFENTPRILVLDARVGFKSTADIIEAARDLGRKRYDVPELIVWRESITVLNDGYELAWMQAVHQESIVVPENIDAIRASLRLASTAEETIKITDETLGIKKFL